jgi:hypothetical protein
MDALASQRAPVALGVVVRVHRHARDSFAGAVESCRIRGADLDPRSHLSREIAHLECRLVGLGESLRETESLLVLEAVGEHARAQELLAFRRMSRDAQIERLVDPAIHMGQIHVELVDRGAESQGDLVMGERG